MNEGIRDKMSPNRKLDIANRVCNTLFGCGKQIRFDSEFRDELSLKEFEISGLCQECQDSVFEGPEAA